jgi:hypothetical protein
MDAPQLKREWFNTIENELPLKRPRLAQDDDEASEQIGDKAKTDPWTGQRVAFPGLDDHGEDEIFYGPPSDGMEYLRMVR